MRLRHLVPAPLRQTARRTHRAVTLRRSLARLQRDPLRAADDPATLRALVYGWGNEGYSAEHEYLAAMIRTAEHLPPGDILECGSGLSTLVLAAVAERTGRRVVTLEHIPAWAARVREALRRVGLTAVADVRDAPLVADGEWTWYRYDGVGRRFALVVCDGPPAATPGGRYGLLPAMREALAPGCAILLDDLERPDEQAILARWTRETGGSAEIVGTDKPFGRLRLPQPE